MAKPIQGPDIMGPGFPDKKKVGKAPKKPKAQKYQPTEKDQLRNASFYKRA